MKRIIDQGKERIIKGKINSTTTALQRIADEVSDMGKKVTAETLIKYVRNPDWERDERKQQIDEECTRIANTLGGKLTMDGLRTLLESKAEDGADYSSDGYKRISRCRAELEFTDFTAEDIIITEEPQTRKVNREANYEDIEKWRQEHPECAMSRYYPIYVSDTEEYIWYRIEFTEDFTKRKLKGAERVLSNEECKEVYKLQQFANLLRHFKNGGLYSPYLTMYADRLSDRELINCSTEDGAAQWFCSYYLGPAREKK